MDHIGRIPKLCKDGFRGRIYSTHATYDLAPIMFEDALKIIRDEAEKEGRRPFYEKEDVEVALSLWKGLDYGEELKFGEHKIKLKDAGHILGSAMIFIDKGGKRLVYTGDLGNAPEPLLPNRDKIEKADYLIIESVYGDRLHEDRKDRIKILKSVLQEAVRGEKTVLIPTFSLERTQILLLEINNLIESGEIEPIKVYLDSPLASKITQIFRKHKDLFKEEIKDQIAGGDDIFSFPNFIEIHDMRESFKALASDGAKVILAGSGMSTGGKILLHERKLLENKNTIILFVGYQGVGTIGRKIQDGVKKIYIDEEWVKVRAKKVSIRGFSAHADRDALLEAVSESRGSLKKVFVALGEMRSSLFFAQRVHDYLGLNVHVPQNGEIIDIDF
jgi:metallo-beta-lactamase family protein